MKKEKEKGFIGTILLIIIALALLKYFLGWSIFDVLKSEQGQQTVAYIREVITAVWEFISSLFDK